jgi:myo-inositol-1(or 4)-monophosphatase
MDINDIRRIGERLKREISSHLEELRSGAPIGKGAGGDTTHPIDKRAEDIVYEELVKLNGPVTLVSEECGTREIRGGGPRLLVDPIDGSRNAISGIPIFSTSIALVDGNTVGQTSIGYVVNLINGDEFWALTGRGSFLNGSPVTTQKDDVFRVIAYEAQTPKADIPIIMPLISVFHRARCFGSTALDMAFLAQGAVSVFVVPSLSRSFDFASGYLLIREAGGMVTDLDGKEIDGIEIGVDRSTPLLASANEEMHRKALEILMRKGLNAG